MRVTIHTDLFGAKAILATLNYQARFGVRPWTQTDDATDEARDLYARYCELLTVVKKAIDDAEAEDSIVSI
jgi:hypothetical protein